MSSNSSADSFYLYNPSHALAILFSILIGLSFLLHVYQNYYYRSWRIMFFMVWGGAVYSAGWVLRAVSSYRPSNANLYIAQTVLTYVGPPIYSAAAYSIISRLMHYLPMFATLNPSRVVFLYIYLGIAVEVLTSNGASQLATAGNNLSKYETGGDLVSIGLVLQAVIELAVMINVIVIHRRAIKAKMLAKNVRAVCFTLYGTSTLVLLRCIFRAVQSFSQYDSSNCLDASRCGSVLDKEWYLYALEGAPMVLFTWWLNLMHPGKYLPYQKTRYLDLDGQTERIGPGWTDKRSKWKTYTDPYDLAGVIKGQPSYDKYWLRPESWPIAKDGSFALMTASNIRSRARE